MIQKTHAETVQIEDDNIHALFFQYEHEIIDRSFKEAASTFLKINKAIIEAVIFDDIDILYHKIHLLQKTSFKILLIYLNDEVLSYNTCNEYDQYNRDYWSKIDKDILPNLDEKHLCDTSDAVQEILGGLEKIFKHRLLLGTDVTDEKHSIIDSEISEIIERGKQKLNPILPLFSILATERRLNKKFKKVEADADKIARIKEDIIEIHAAEIIDKESKNFNRTANLHWARGFFSISICFLLGYLTVIWALGIKEPLLIGDFLIPQNKGCSPYTSIVLYLCKAASLPKQLLVGVVLITGIYASLRSYFANANSGAINRHRFNALQAYKHLYQFAEDNDKSLVMQKATEAIFEHVPTGFNKHHKEDSKSSDNNAQLTPLIAASLAATTKAITRGGGTGTPSA